MMLLFLCCDDQVALREDALTPTDDSDELVLYRDINGALEMCGKEQLWVINAFELEDRGVPMAQDARGRVRVPFVPLSAVENRESRLPVRPVAAGGGIVVRRRNGGLSVLLIFRKGFWDLPKGKLDEGEPADEGALREVGEEIGVSHLSIEGYLGFTTHGYVEHGEYCAKTTHWYLMTTVENHFTPQESERIEEVRWVPWETAKEMVGYRVLKRQMEHVERLIAESVSNRVS